MLRVLKVLRVQVPDMNLGPTFCSRKANIKRKADIKNKDFKNDNTIDQCLAPQAPATCVLKCVAMCCSVVQCVAVCCNEEACLLRDR
jgi:hypothetical protein